MPHPLTAGPYTVEVLTTPSLSLGRCVLKKIYIYQPRIKPVFVSKGGCHANKNATAAELLYDNFNVNMTASLLTVTV